MHSRKAWTQQEDSAILELVAKHGLKNWANISNDMSHTYGYRFRSGKQCRERWHNHLDPQICKKNWSKQEEEIMFRQHRLNGNKWTVIAEQLPGRTDNAIKNYFYSTIRRSLRRMNKLVGLKNSTMKMKWIKPSTLSKIFSIDANSLSKEENATDPIALQRIALHQYLRQNCENVKDEIMQFTNFKPKRKDMVSEEERIKFERVIQKMETINKIYERIKQHEKKRKEKDHNYREELNHLLNGSEESCSAEEEDNDEEKQQFNVVVKTQMTRSRRHIKPPVCEVPIKLNRKRRRYKEGQEVQTTLLEMQPKNLSIDVARGALRTDQNNKNKTMQGFNDSARTEESGTFIEELLNQNESEHENIENPEFSIQIKDQIGSNSRALGDFFVMSPSACPQLFRMMSPALTPKVRNDYQTNDAYSSLHQRYDQTRANLKKQIENNLSQSDNSKEFLMPSKIIASPRSAFRYCSEQH